MLRIITVRHNYALDQAISRRSLQEIAIKLCLRLWQIFNLWLNEWLINLTYFAHSTSLEFYLSVKPAFERIMWCDAGTCKAGINVEWNLDSWICECLPLSFPIADLMTILYPLHLYGYIYICSMHNCTLCIKVRKKLYKYKSKIYVYTTV